MVIISSRVFSARNFAIGLIILLIICMVLLGRNTPIINVQITNGGGTGTLQSFDEKKTEDCSNVDKIEINSPIANVNVSVSNSSDVEAHLYGEVNRELKITLQYTGNCFGGALKLDVSVPQRIFKVIAVNSSSANITLSQGVSTDYLKIYTMSGNLKTYATVNNVSVSTMSGDVNLYINAIQNISAELSTMSGDVLLEFGNIGNINFSARSMSGDIMNCHKLSKGFSADVDISTMSGDIRVK